jgi:hypothetical protein
MHKGDETHEEKVTLAEILELRKYSTSTLMAKSKDYLVKALEKVLSLSNLDFNSTLTDFQCKLSNSFDYIQKENAKNFFELNSVVMGDSKQLRLEHIELQNTIAKLNGNFTILNDKFNNLNTKYIDLLKEDNNVSQMKLQIEELRIDNAKLTTDFSNNKLAINDAVEFRQLKISSEETEKALRKKNIIITGLPEDTNDRDKTTLTNLGKGLNLDLGVIVLSHRRLGKFKANTRSRPLLLELAKESDKFLIFSLAKPLRNSEQFKEVYIGPDLTRHEQSEHKRLRDKLKVEKTKPENNGITFSIRGGKLFQGDKVIDKVSPLNFH